MKARSDIANPAPDTVKKQTNLMIPKMKKQTAGKRRESTDAFLMYFGCLFSGIWGAHIEEKLYSKIDVF